MMQAQMESRMRLFACIVLAIAVSPAIGKTRLKGATTPSAIPAVEANIDGYWRFWNPLTGPEQIMVEQNGRQFSIDKEIDNLPAIGVVSAFAKGTIGNGLLNLTYRYNLKAHEGAGSCDGHMENNNRISWRCEGAEVPSSVMFDWIR